MINKHANQMVFFLLLNVNDYQPCSLQVAGDHFAIIMGPVLSIYLFKIFIKQQLVHDEKITLTTKIVPHLLISGLAVISYY